MTSALAAEPYAAPPARPEHRRNKSASKILKAFINPRSPDPAPFDMETLASPSSDAGLGYNRFAMPLLPPNHPHSGQPVLGELRNLNSPVPPESLSREEKRTGLVKKSKSSVSLRSLGKDKKKSSQKDEQRTPSSPKKMMKKTKSSTHLGGLLGKAKPKEKDDPKRRLARDQENTPPPQAATTPVAAHTPIWAEFATQQTPHEITTTSKVPLNDSRSRDDKIALYTPVNYSPSKQRNFHGPYQPTLVSKHSMPRPKSAQIVSTQPATMVVPDTSILETFTRRVSGEREKPDSSKRNNVHAGDDTQPRKSSWERVIGRKSCDDPRPHVEQPKQAKQANTPAKKGGRVMAAVATFNCKSKEIKEPEKEKERPLDPAQIDAEFEAVLESRNIPADLRPKMRALTTRIKADFIKSHQVEIDPAGPTLQTRSTSAKSSYGKNASSTKRHADDVGKAAASGPEGDAGSQCTENSGNASSKHTRSRSRGFTFGRGDKRDASPAKKSKHERSTSTKSIVIPGGPTTPTLASPDAGKVSFFSKTPKAATPDEFVAYLRQTQKPEEVEVGRVHKLRLLLRNETVSWVDCFIEQGGMKEIVELLHRIMRVEWREEHEDSLLHETLLCLKGLCTTDLALRKLCEIEATLFPALLAMLFDTEHKGPSEFTTRQIIINLLFVHLAAAPKESIESRARRILSYVADPKTPEADQPHTFLLEMHQSRPYRIWCREVVNVTKEVFWIFLHHLNVIALPKDDSVFDNEETYLNRHFPKPRPPVPAAPYVGGVEWDATNYLSSHLDLLNGLLATLPTATARNALRTDLKNSGFEKIMGASLRTCKEKFYGAVHDALRTWVTAAKEDGWEVRDVRMGPKEEVISPRKKGSPKKKGDEAPKLEAPKMGLEKLSLGIGGGPIGDGEDAKVVDDWV